MSKVLSGPSRRHFSRAEYRAPPHVHRVRWRTGDHLAGRSRRCDQDAIRDRPGPAGVSRAAPVTGAAGRHDPGKIITDLAMALALGGDCLADVAVLRAQPDLFGPVASDPVVSRLVASLAADTPRALKPTRAAQAAPQHLRAVKADALSPAENGVHTGGSCGMRNSSRPGVRICR